MYTHLLGVIDRHLVNMGSRKIPSSEGLDALRSSGSCYETKTSGADVQKLKTGVCNHTKECPNCTTIARIYMEDTPNGFFIQVFENQSRRPRRFRMLEQQMVESRLDFMTVIPVKAFVKVSIQRRLEEMEIRVECLAVRDKGYDCGSVRISRSSWARRLFHIVFKPREEMVRIWVHELSDFKEDFQSSSLTPSSAGETRRNDDASDINHLESPDSQLTESASTGSMARIFTASPPPTFGSNTVYFPPRPSPSSSDEVLDRSSTTGSSLSSGENDDPGEVELGRHPQISTVDSTAGYSTDDSSVSTGSSGSSTADIFLGKRYRRQSTADCPAVSSVITNLTKAKGNQGKLNELATPQKFQSSIETSAFSYINCDRDEDECKPLLGSPSRGIVRKKRIASIMRKAEDYVQSFLRRATTTIQ